ncbi:MAG TPA: hypothetical protein VGG37_05945 [Opitutaceae bacterium]
MASGRILIAAVLPAILAVSAARAQDTPPAGQPPAGQDAPHQEQAAPYSIPDAETMDPPTPGRLQSIEREATAASWNGMVIPLRAAAVSAYGHQRFKAADAWYHVYRWSALFSEPENVFIDGWIGAIVQNHLNYEGVAGTYTPTDRPIGLNLSAATQAWVLSHEDFSEQFFSNAKSVDHLPNSFAILDSLYRRNPEQFSRYSSLALAIALVFDVKPPPWWPHGQVSAQALPRRLPKPEDAFDRLVREDSAGRTYHRLTRLPAEELKFVVDAAAPAPELAWAEANVPFTLDAMDEVYQSIAYRNDRAVDYAKGTWQGTPYTLQAIKAQGGICVDQAYYATEVGKARGVPTLLFYGAGQDARHAWFGYLNAEHHWDLDAGRYAEERLITGNTLDPQTWKEMSDHELEFLSERFRALPAFMQSRVYEEFADDFLRIGNPSAAAKAARKAVDYERRNLDAWETLLAADEALKVGAPQREAVMREAAHAFSPKYPDLVAGYVNRVCESLRKRGESSLADYEERGLADRLKGDRADITITQASGILERSIATQSLADQVSTYQSILDQYGHGAGTLFFDRIVTAFAEHLAGLKMKPDAREAVRRAQEALDVQPGTQLAIDVDKLMARLQD